MNLKDLGKSLIAKGLPVLGFALAGRDGASVGSMIANAIGASSPNADDIVAKINADPEAQLKLLTLQNEHSEFLQKNALEFFEAENADRDSARQANVKNQKITDEIIKFYLVIALSCVIYFCIYAIFMGNVQGEEANIVSTVLGSAFTAMLSMVYFYWGNSAGAKAKDDAMIDHFTKH